MSMTRATGRTGSERSIHSCRTRTMHARSDEHVGAIKMRRCVALSKLRTARCSKRINPSGPFASAIRVVTSPPPVATRHVTATGSNSSSQHPPTTATATTRSTSTTGSASATTTEARASARERLQPWNAPALNMPARYSALPHIVNPHSNFRQILAWRKHIRQSALRGRLPHHRHSNCGKLRQTRAASGKRWQATKNPRSLYLRGFQGVNHGGC